MSAKPELAQALSPASDQDEIKNTDKAAELEKIKQEKEKKAAEQKAKQGTITAEEKKAQREAVKAEKLAKKQAAKEKKVAFADEEAAEEIKEFKVEPAKPAAPV